MSELHRQVVAIREAAEARARTDPKHAEAWRAQAQAEAAPLIAEAEALRDAIVVHAQRRARLAWRVVYAGCALIALLLVLRLV